MTPIFRSTRPLPVAIRAHRAACERVTVARMNMDTRGYREATQDAQKALHERMRLERQHG